MFKYSWKSLVFHTPLNEIGINLAAPEKGIVQNLEVKGDGGFDIFHLELAQGSLHPLNSFNPIVSPGYQFGHHRIVVLRYEIVE